MNRNITIEHNGHTYVGEPGIIESTHLGVEDHGIFTATLILKYDGSGQGAGQICLDTYDTEREERVGTAFGLDHIMQILRVVGVYQWEQLVGQQVIALKRDAWGLVLGLAHPIEDRVFIFEEHADEWTKVIEA